jgi:hypothetical protein
VLHDFDGYTWRRGAGEAYRQPALRYLGEPFRYSVTLVPDANRWWFTLDTVVGSPDKHAFLSYDYDLIAREPVTQLTTYDAVSYTHTESSEPLSNFARKIESRGSRLRACGHRLLSHRRLSVLPHAADARPRFRG